MPLTSDLALVDSKGIITGTQFTPPYFDLATNTFYLEGCPTYTSSTANTVTMYKMKNKGHVMDTGTFAVYLWALDKAKGVKYPIAKKDANLYFRAD